MDASVIVSTMSEVPNPMNLPIHKVGDFKGFEIWKGNAGSKAHIYFRYTAFGKPVVVVKGVGSSPDSLYCIKRMMVYYTPFTSVKSFKDFIRVCVEGV